MIRGAPACHNWSCPFRDVDKSQLLCMFLECLWTVLMGRQWDLSQVFSEDNRGFHVLSEELWFIFTFEKGEQWEIQEWNVFHALQISEDSESLQTLKENLKSLVSYWDGSGSVLEGPDERGELEEPQKHPRIEQTKMPLRQSWTDQSNTGLLHRRQRPVSHMLIAWRKWLF